MRTIVIILAVILLTGCSTQIRNYCYKNYPPDTTERISHKVFRDSVEVVVPGKHFMVPTFIDCDTITDTLTIYTQVEIEPETIYIQKIDTVAVIKKGEVVTVKEKNKVNGFLIGAAVALLIVVVVLVYLILKLRG